MAKDVITRFKLETTQYDSKIKNAAKELSDIAKSAKSAGADFERFTKDSLEAARSLGNVATSSTNAKDRAKELVGAFNDVARSYNQLTEEQKKSDFGKAMAQSLTQLQQRIRDTKEEMKGLESGGGLFGGGKLDGMLQVFGGNLMTKGVELAASAMTSLISETGDMIKQGVELAKQGEGIRIAFDRLGRGDIMDGLREATHGTVSDLELMKAAVKFNDFKLPLEELGTMLAFAQQKAKDTGQSVDYMVDSIVTGLGRKSLMILDNLGLSAAEIKERMKETGDMTKAVGAIIRDQMQQAGDYVETAADRALQANVSLQNKMEELGRKFAPIEEASNQLWTSMKIGILDIIGGPLSRMLNELTEAGRQMNALRDINGDGSNGAETRSGKALRILREYSGGGRGIEGKRELYDRQVASFQSQEEKEWRKANRLREELAGLRKQKKENGLAGNLQPLIDDTTRQLEAAENRAKAFQIARNEYEKGAQGILNSKTQNTTTTTTTDSKKNKEKELTELQQNQQKINDLTQEYVKLGDESTEAARERQAEIQKEIALLEKRNSLLGLRAEQAKGRLMAYAGDFDKPTKNLSGFGLLDSATDFGKKLEIPKDGLQLDDKAMKAVTKDIYKNSQKEQNKNLSKEQAIEGMGDLIGGVNNVFGGLQQMGIEIPQEISSVMGVLNGILTVVMGIESIITVGQFLGIFHNGGIVPGFNNGGIVPGFANGGTVEAGHALDFLSFSKAMPKFATGGVIGKAAAGMLIPGNSFSGDNLRMPIDGGRGVIGVNSGELILNKSSQNNLAAMIKNAEQLVGSIMYDNTTLGRAQQGNLASQLQGGVMQNLNLTATIKGEQIRLALNNNGRRTGRGEYVQSRNVR